MSVQPPFLALSREPLPKPERPGGALPHQSQREALSWIESPIDERDEEPRLYRNTDATPVELFLDLFLVANLSTFTATHEINNIEALATYIGFLGVIWFTWLQVTLFDIRFARDSIVERTCKAVQLGVMVGFASAGSRFTVIVQDENVWAFQSISLFLAGSRILLAVEYAVNTVFVNKKMNSATKGMCGIAATLLISSLIYVGTYFALMKRNELRSSIWSVWFVLFAFEMWIVMGLSCATPGIGFEDTHLNVRMGLLTLIIIGEGVIAVTRIVNKTVGPGGWTRWSFAHIVGVTTNVYFVWQAYYDLSPRIALGKLTHQVWAQLHFPFHVVLILLLEGSQILALTLDITTKLTYLAETILYACEEPRPSSVAAVKLLNSTVADMEINYNRGALREKQAISNILVDLAKGPLCPAERGRSITVLSSNRMNDLMGNVTAALFSSMGITPPEQQDISQLNSAQLLRVYMGVLGFVYVYFFVVAALAMGLFAAFGLLARRHQRKLYVGIGAAVRIFLAMVLGGMILFAARFSLSYAFMTSPAILYAFTLVLLTVLLVDRLLDYLAGREEGKNPEQTQTSNREVKLLTSASVFD